MKDKIGLWMIWKENRFREEYGDELREATKNGVYVSMKWIDWITWSEWILKLAMQQMVRPQRIKGESDEFKKKASLVQGLLLSKMNWIMYCRYRLQVALIQRLEKY